MHVHALDYSLYNTPVQDTASVRLDSLAQANGEGQVSAYGRVREGCRLGEYQGSYSILHERLFAVKFL